MRRPLGTATDAILAASAIMMCGTWAQGSNLTSRSLRTRPSSRQEKSPSGDGTHRKLFYWATCKGTALEPGEVLQDGECLCNGEHNGETLYYFCMYDGWSLLSDVQGEGYTYWAAPDSEQGDYVKMQEDGNLVAYKTKSNGGSDEAVWDSGTEGNDGARLKLSEQGIATIEAAGAIANVLWAEYERGCKWVSDREKNTVLEPRERLFRGQYLCRNYYRFGLDDDGDLGIFYRPDGQDNDEGVDDDAYYNDYEDDWTSGHDTIWSAGTDGDDGFYVHMQADGNLVVYNKDMKAVWDSGTSGNPNSVLNFGGGKIRIARDIWDMKYP